MKSWPGAIRSLALQNDASYESACAPEEENGLSMRMAALANQQKCTTSTGSEIGSVKGCSTGTECPLEEMNKRAQIKYAEQHAMEQSQRAMEQRAMEQRAMAQVAPPQLPFIVGYLPVAYPVQPDTAFSGAGMDPANFGAPRNVQARNGDQSHRKQPRSSKACSGHRSCHRSSKACSAHVAKKTLLKKQSDFHPPNATCSEDIWEGRVGKHEDAINDMKDSLMYCAGETCCKAHQHNIPKSLGRPQTPDSRSRLPKREREAKAAQWRRSWREIDAVKRLMVMGYDEARSIQGWRQAGEHPRMVEQIARIHKLKVEEKLKTEMKHEEQIALTVETLG